MLDSSIILRIMTLVYPTNNLVTLYIEGQVKSHGMRLATRCEADIMFRRDNSLIFLKIFHWDYWRRIFVAEEVTLMSGGVQCDTTSHCVNSNRRFGCLVETPLLL